MRVLAVLSCVLATALGAQQPGPPPPESTRAESIPAPAPPPPSPEQKRFLDGLHTANRGIAQLKDGIGRVTRAQSTNDSMAQRRAGRFLAGLCGSARAFLRRGRPQMNLAAYSDSTRLVARRLLTQLDSLIAYAPSCEHDAAATPGPTASELAKRMKAYDQALRDFRLAIGLPIRDDTSRTRKKP